MTDALLLIAALHWAVLVTPGPNVIVVTQLAASGQRRSALAAALGVSTVAGIWAALAGLGLHAVFTAHAGLRHAAQAAGSLYLLWIALKLWRSGGAPVGPDTADTGLAQGFRRGFRRGFLTNILNPKSALFFGSVFATALPATPSARLLAAAVGLVLCNALLWHVVLALVFSRTRVRAAYAGRRRQLNRLAAVLAAAFGCRLKWELLRELVARHPSTPASTSQW